jgi:hypothetical protein
MSKELSENLLYEDDDLLSEKTLVSFHHRTPTQMALLHKAELSKKGHTILAHETTGQGDHVIAFHTPKKTVRVSTISGVHGRKRYNSKVHNRPGTTDEMMKYIKK